MKPHVIPMDRAKTSQPYEGRIRVTQAGRHALNNPPLASLGTSNPMLLSPCVVMIRPPCRRANRLSRTPLSPGGGDRCCSSNAPVDAWTLTNSLLQRFCGAPGCHQEVEGVSWRFRSRGAPPSFPRRKTRTRVEAELGPFATTGWVSQLGSVRSQPHILRLAGGTRPPSAANPGCGSRAL